MEAKQTSTHRLMDKQNVVHHTRHGALFSLEKDIISAKHRHTTRTLLSEIIQAQVGEYHVVALLGGT